MDSLDEDEEEYQQRYRKGILTDQKVQDDSCLGPFSYHSYLTALLEPTMWGDDHVLCLCSMMWQIGLTVVSAEEVTQVKFRHKAALSKADAVLVMCLGQHHVPAHKYLQLLCPDGYVLQPDSCILYPDGSFLHLDSCFVFLSHYAQTTGYIATRQVPVVPRQLYIATGQVTTITHSLVADSFSLAPGYDATKEDPDIYKTRFLQVLSF